MECKYDKCENEAVGASAFCCASHRAQQSRRNITGATPKLLPTEALERLESAAKSTRPPCTPDQLTSSCLACVDKPDCSYLHNMNSAVPGDADYARVI